MCSLLHNGASTQTDIPPDESGTPAAAGDHCMYNTCSFCCDVHQSVLYACITGSILSEAAVMFHQADASAGRCARSAALIPLVVTESGMWSQV